jgi:hypothetical protein
MCKTFPTCESSEVVMQRISAEIGAVADDLLTLEEDIAALISGGKADGMEGLQSLDRLGQHLRALKTFLGAAKPCQCGRVDIDNALDRVWLEGVRKRLGGGGGAVAAAVSEPELW